jgi:FkbM family methyltransferase
MRIGNQPLPIDLADKTTSINLYRGFYERAELEVTRRLVSPGDSCIDVGANAGLYTITMRVLAGTSGRIVAFEPHPQMANKLRAVIANSHGAPVHLVEAALGSEEGLADLHIFAENTGYSTLRDRNVQSSETVAVRVCRLADVPEVRAMPEIALLKIDVESWEAEVLAGANPLFQSGTVRACLVELAVDETAHRIAAFVRAQHAYLPFLIGYTRGRFRFAPSLQRVTAERITEGSPTWSNLLLLRRDATQDVQTLVR